MSDIRLDQTNTILLIVDVQEKLFKAMHKKQQLKNNLEKLIKGCKILKLPVIFLEQNPQGLGNTLEELNIFENASAVFQKMTFGIKGHADFFNFLTNTKRKNILLCGIESHVCVLQCGLDLISKGYNINLISDCVSSRTHENCQIGIKRLIQANALYSSVETALFDILKSCNSKEFKLILELVK